MENWLKLGINPDDLTGWDAGNHIGGQTNNTCITRSLVLGSKIGLLIDSIDFII